MKKIALYGKGGIGKSTTACNLSISLAKTNTVLQIGCDPKADSTKNLMGGRRIPTVLDQIKEKGEHLKLDDLVFQGAGGVYCVEAGGPTPGIGCAGLGIIAALQKLDELEAFARIKPDIVLYDVLGDVVCGGFAMPIRDGYAQEIFIVTSGEMMALYAAHNIVSAVKNFSSRGYARCAGLILNRRNVPRELEMVQRAASEMGVDLIADIRRSSVVQDAEDKAGTAVGLFPESRVAEDYRRAAYEVLLRCEQRDREQRAPLDMVYVQDNLKTSKRAIKPFKQRII